jgi:hypothetical protein
MKMKKVDPRRPGIPSSEAEALIKNPLKNYTLDTAVVDDL